MNDSLSDDESIMPPVSVASTPSTRSGGRNIRPEILETPTRDSHSAPQMETPDTPPTPRSTLTELDSVAQRGHDNPSEQGQQQVQEVVEGEPAAPLRGIINEAHIRGTDVHVPRVADVFTNFLLNFVSLEVSKRSNRSPDESDDDDDNDSLFSQHSDAETEPLYKAKLQRILAMEIEGSASLEIDAMHLFYHNEACQQLYHQLVQYPKEIVPLMDSSVKWVLETLAQNMDVPIPDMQVRPFNLKKVSNLRELDPVAMDCLVCCKGMIVRTSSVIPDLKVAHFGCAVCGNSEIVTIDRGHVTEPTDRCGNCNTLAWEMVHNRCVFADKQMVRLQETPDEVPAGQTPASVVTFCFDDLVDQVHPGKFETNFISRIPGHFHVRLSSIFYIIQATRWKLQGYFERNHFVCTLELAKSNLCSRHI